MLTGVAIAGAFITLACLVGLVAYAKYYDCDLLQSGVSFTKMQVFFSSCHDNKFVAPVLRWWTRRIRSFLTS